MTRAVLAAACALAVSVGGQQGAPPPPTVAQQAQAPAAPDRGVLAVMRRDGLLIPFAAYKGSRWSAPWPGTIQNVAVPIDLSAIPDDWWGGEAPASWQLSLPGGVTRTVSATKPRVYRSFCDMRVGLVTDYRSADPVPMPPTDPYPKDGVATSPGLQLLPIESVDRASPEMPRLAQAMISEFDKAEEKTLNAIRNREGWRHPAKPLLRKATPVTIEAWYRTPMDEPGWTVSYVEAVRSYPPGPEDDGCGLQTVFTGWIHANSEDPRKTRVQITARVTYCDRRGVTYMLPFGRFHVGQQLYWVYQLSSFDHEWYEVARMTPLKMSFVVEAYGGGAGGCRMRPGPE